MTVTPIISDLEKYFRVLNLLDPKVFEFDVKKNSEQKSFTDFKNKIHSRQNIARIIADLNPNNLAFVNNSIKSLKEIIEDDERLLSLEEDFKKCYLKNLQDKSDLSVFKSLQKIRSYIIETYKIDRRLLRNRRNSIEHLYKKSSINSPLPIRKVFQSGIMNQTL